MLRDCTYIKIATVAVHELGVFRRNLTNCIEIKHVSSPVNPLESLVNELVNSVYRSFQCWLKHS